MWNDLILSIGYWSTRQSEDQENKQGWRND